eukprot:Clim_evm37s199 gene=Clim_evmTU37s199
MLSLHEEKNEEVYILVRLADATWASSDLPGRGDHKQIPFAPAHAVRERLQQLCVPMKANRDFDWESHLETRNFNLLVAPDNGHRRSILKPSRGKERSNCNLPGVTQNAIPDAEAFTQKEAPSVKTFIDGLPEPVLATRKHCKALDMYRDNTFSSLLGQTQQATGDSSDSSATGFECDPQRK